MFYIENNDKPNWFERTFNLIKLQDDTLIIPICEKTNQNQIQKLAEKTNKIIKKYSKSNKIILSKNINNKYLNLLNSYDFEIQNGKFLKEILLTDIVEYTILKMQLKKENTSISILINDLNDIEFENIKILSKEYKNVNVVTNHIEKFKKLKEQLEQEGIIITITNNKKKSLIKSKIIVNFDFPTELINKYNIEEDAIILNLKNKIKINKKRFNGLNIYDYEIDFRDYNKNTRAICGTYYLKDLYEASLYRKQGFKELRKTIKNDKVIIKKLILNSGSEI